MSAAGSKLRRIEGGRVAFWCPGCQEAHQIRVEGERSGPRWSFDGDCDAPTFEPSVLVRTQWSAVDNEMHDEVCHSFVRAGRIEFLGDCTHALAGTTVDLPDWPAA